MQCTREIASSMNTTTYIKHNKTKFEILAEPMPWSVYTRMGKPGAGFLNMKSYQEILHGTVKQGWHPRAPITGPLELEFVFARSIPKSANKTQPKRDMWCDNHILMRPDVTNYQKSAEDALKGIIFNDDSQVIKVTSRKIYTEGGGYTCITITTPSRMQEEL
jgi:Holliday junction resolvase RusA-like endonuclease